MKTKDFFLRAPGDPNYIENKFESNDQIENTIEQVRMTILTKRGEVLGEPTFGLDATKYLFEFDSFPIKSLEKVAQEQIGEYVSLSKIYTVKAEAFSLSETSDLYRVGIGLDITVDGRQAFAALFED